MTHNIESKDLKHNYIANIGDGAFFGFGVGFASFSTVIPLFIATLTSSATLIGLIPAIHNMGWQLPQLLVANRISRMERVKPYMMFMTIQERLPILGLALVGLFLPHLNVTKALIISFVLLVWQGIGAGLTANPWQIMISKIIPGEIRATFFGFQSAAANMLASLGAFLAGLLLTRLDSPWDFVSCFLIASGLYVVSWIFLNQSREPKIAIESSSVPTVPLWTNIKEILKADRSFRNFLIGRFVSQFGMMAFAFYTVYAVKQLGMNAMQVGIMTSVLMITQVVSAPLLGRLSDKWSRKSVLGFGNACAAISALIAITVTNVYWFFLVFVLNGIANAAYWTIGMTISLEFGNESQRPTYVGMSNTLIAPATILAPMIGGMLADTFSYSVTFIVSAVLGVIAMIMLSFLVKDPRKQRTAS